MTARDNQRSKLFAAQKMLERFSNQVTDGYGFATTVLNSRHWKGMYEACSLSATKAHHGCSCSRTAPGIVTTCDAWDVPHLFLHGLAHIRVSASESVAPHGVEFAREYLDLVKRYLGVEAADTLRAAFRTHHVKTRSMSPEAKAAARERYLDRQANNLQQELEALRERINAGKD